MEKGYKKLEVWKKADALAKAVYAATSSFPKDEVYGVTSQLRRAALSVPVNIVEGTGRQGNKELKQFANIALGSLAETEYLLEFCKDVGYLPEKVFAEVETLRCETGRLLWCFYKSL
ncbi:MAG: four helix bundle protein [Elusimicrobia bacterium GWC2_51_8]|nr:MAG: four helix bundle protein [Elusimicrobia bacterium GWA2_51_34]OGR58431.1 MAG: four helix bundle protein [Elusimicrobia bacterium GWC2_51_8]HAF96116.1 four helix bundle protein [Elusimicrobiota bacterium]HCE97458.1 four helix bundle protein [Elusimicrobiota bacterium]